MNPDRGELMKKAVKNRAVTQAVLATLGLAMGATSLAAFGADKAEQKAEAVPAVASAAPAQPGSAADAAHAGAPPTEWAFFEHYCGKCHNSTDWAGGVAFDTMQPDSLYDDAHVWE